MGAYRREDTDTEGLCLLLVKCTRRFPDHITTVDAL